MTARCPSSLEVARWEAARAADGSDLHDLSEHFKSCLHCSAVAEEIAAARADVLPGDPALTASWAARRIAAVVADRRADERRRHWRLFGLLAARAVAACVLLAVIVPHFGRKDRPASAPVAMQDAGDRVKGHLVVEAYCKRKDDVFRVQDGAAFRAGDRLRFAYTCAKAGYLMIFGVDDRGQISPYYGEGTLTAVAVAAAAAAMLPGSVELDDRRGFERVYALWSEKPIDAVGVREAVAKAIAAGSLDDETVGRLPLPADQVSYLLRRP